MRGSRTSTPNDPADAPRARVADLACKVALVVGGTSGIGRATAELLAAEGAAVVVAGRRAAVGEAVADAIRAAGGSAAFEQVEVADAASVDRCVAAVAARHGRLDVAVNAAASTAGLGARLHEIAVEAGDEQLRVTLHGAWHCMRAEVRLMLEHGGGTIVNVASTNGLSGTPDFALYSAAKHGVIGLSKSVALEYARDGVRVNVVCPGATDTEMLAQAFALESPDGPAAARAARIARAPQGRIGAPQEVAEAIAWLAGPRSSYVLGQVLVVDGGDST